MHTFGMVIISSLSNVVDSFAHLKLFNFSDGKDPLIKICQGTIETVKTWDDVICDYFYGVLKID